MNAPPSCLACGTEYSFALAARVPGFTSNLFDSLSLSNDLVSDTDTAALRDHVRPLAVQGLSAVERDMAGIEAAMSRLRVAQFRLKSERNRLSAMVSRIRALSSAIRRFPVEILAHIFQLRCDDRDTHIFDTSQGPWALSKVCRRWRSIAVSLPGLWTSVTVLDHLARNNTTGWKSLLAIAMERTRGHPISVQFEGQDFEGNEAPLELERQWLLAIMQYSSRWASASITVSDRSSIGPLYDITAPLAFPLLHTLAFILPEGGGSETELVLFKDATQLRRAFMAISYLTVPIPCSNLRTVRIEESGCYTTSRRMYDTLRDAGRLESLRVQYKYDCGLKISGLLPPLVHSPVRDLRIRPSRCNPQLDYRFVAPNLEVLHIDGMLGSQVELLEFLRRSRCPLQELMIRTPLGFTCSSLIEVLLAIFELVPCLCRISVQVDHASSLANIEEITEEAYRKFVRAMDTDVIAGLPHVVSFTVDYGRARRCCIV